MTPDTMVDVGLKLEAHLPTFKEGEFRFKCCDRIFKPKDGFPPIETVCPTCAKDIFFEGLTGQIAYTKASGGSWHKEGGWRYGDSDFDPPSFSSTKELIKYIKERPLHWFNAFKSYTQSFECSFDSYENYKKSLSDSTLSWSYKRANKLKNLCSQQEKMKKLEYTATNKQGLYWTKAEEFTTTINLIRILKNIFNNDNCPYYLGFRFGEEEFALLRKLECSEEFFSTAISQQFIFNQQIAAHLNVITEHMRKAGTELFL